jgi:DNA repair ATPase RecN
MNEKQIIEKAKEINHPFWSKWVKADELRRLDLVKNLITSKSFRVTKNSDLEIIHHSFCSLVNSYFVDLYELCSEAHKKNDGFSMNLKLLEKLREKEKEIEALKRKIDTKEDKAQYYKKSRDEINDDFQAMTESIDKLINDIKDMARKSYSDDVAPHIVIQRLEELKSKKGGGDSG